MENAKTPPDITGPRIVVPSGLEAFFAEIGKPVAIGEFLAPPPMDGAAIKRLVPTVQI